MITFNSVVKIYSKTAVVDNVSLDIKNSEFFVIIGPSGSGKTTLLKMINKMEKPTKGKIYINNTDISKINGTALRRKIGYVIQNVGLLPHMNVEENVSIVPKLLKADKNRIHMRVRYMLQLVGLEPDIYLSKYPSQLSGGEAQRIGIARALAADPPIILMDEPFGALDPITRLHLQNSISQIHKELKKTIVFVTHDIDEAIKIGQKIAIIKSGKIVQIDTPQNILSRPKDNFVASFLGSDRALKKLSKLYVKEFQKKAKKVFKDKISSVNNMSKEKYVWVIDQNGTFRGWIDLSMQTENLKDIYTQADYKTFSLEMDDTLKDAVSKMVWQSVRILPVCSKNGKLVGEIDLLDIITKT